MKVHIGNRKSGNKPDEKAQYGLTVYAADGKVMHSSVLHDEVSENKFENGLKALDWGIKKVKTLCQNKTLSENEDIVVIIGSKTIYGWFEKELAPEPYTTMLSDIFLEMSFFLNRLEIIFSQSGDKRILYRNSSEDKGTRVTDMFKDRV